MKIVEAINSMITNKDKIDSVIKNDSEFFFLYNKKYKWSILTNNGNYSIFLYPKDDISIEQLASWDSLQFNDYSDMVTYRTEDIKTRESLESFAELYNIVSSKVFGVDNILDDIINDDTY